MPQTRCQTCLDHLAGDSMVTHVLRCTYRTSEILFQSCDMLIEIRCTSMGWCPAVWQDSSRQCRAPSPSM